MGIYYLLLIAITAPLLFFMLVWGVVTAYRLLVPEEPIPFDADPVMLRQQATAEGAHMPVGAREIREDQRHFFDEQRRAPYAYVLGESEGLPAIWMEDLWRRRN